ncbi:MAG TPA: baseplate J/gp47 family protein [Polyangiaceae bacterium]|nr:baseplate J/gp47 family protein [Polyangiaceae bacterium]
MAILPESLDYTARDFDALRTRLYALIRSAFPEWTDDGVAGFGNVLVEMYAFVGDVLGYYLDNHARESRLVTATQRTSVIALARMLGYRLAGARAATAVVRVTLARPPLADVVLPAGTVVRTQEVTEPVRFQLLAPVTIPAGADPPVALGTVEHATTHTQAFEAKALGGTDLELDFVPFLDGSAVVTAGNGTFTELESLLPAGPNDRAFLTLVDQSGRATLRFGSGVSGAPPTGTLEVTYKTGGGAAGNVEAGRLVVLEGAFADAAGRPVQVSVTNPERASGGVDRQSLASAKLLAPESLRALTRSVAREDFEINARRLPAVARALMLTSNEDPTIAENSGVLYVVPRGGGPPTPALKNLVLHQVTVAYPCTLTFQVSVQDPVYKVVGVTARLYLRPGETPAVVRDRVRTRLVDFFRVSEPDGTPNPRVDFGFNVRDAEGRPAGELAWSDVFDVVRDTPGVRKVGGGVGDLRLNGLPADVKLAPREFPVLGDVALTDGDTGILL